MGGGEEKKEMETVGKPKIRREEKKEAVQVEGKSKIIEGGEKKKETEAERIIQTKQGKMEGKKEKVVEETVTKGKKERRTKQRKKKKMIKRLAGIIKIWTTPPTTSYGVLIFLWNKF